MEKVAFSDKLSEYDRYILNKIIDRFDPERDFNIYALIEEAVSYKCLLPSINTIIMETYYAIREYLVAHGFLIEKKEMSDYLLSEKGRTLKLCGSIERFEEKETKARKRSLFHRILFRDTARHAQNLTATY